MLSFDDYFDVEGFLEEQAKDIKYTPRCKRMILISINNDMKNI